MLPPILLEESVPIRIADRMDILSAPLTGKWHSYTNSTMCIFTLSGSIAFRSATILHSP